MASYKKKVRFLSVVGYVVVFLFVSAVVGFFAVFTNGFNDGFRTFYLTYNNESILSNKKGLSLPLETENRFDCVSTLGRLSKSKVDFTVKIIPNPKNDFDFTVDGDNAKFSHREDYTDGFDITLADDYFILFFDKDITMKSILSRAYDSGNVVVSEALDISAKDYFILCVFAGEKNSVIKIEFRLGTYLLLNVEGIVF